MEDRLIVDCQCNSTDHLLVITALDEDIYIEALLNSNLGFFKRTLIGIKFIFGLEAKTGTFVEHLVSEKGATQIINFLKTNIERRK